MYPLSSGPIALRTPKQRQAESPCHLFFKQQLPATAFLCLRESSRKNPTTNLSQRHLFCQIETMRLESHLFFPPRHLSQPPPPNLPFPLLPLFLQHQFVLLHSIPLLVHFWIPQPRLPRLYQDFCSLLPPPRHQLIHHPPKFYLMTLSPQAGWDLSSQSDAWEREIRTKYTKGTPADYLLTREKCFKVRISFDFA